jgi:hypothetical protein
MNAGSIKFTAHLRPPATVEGLGIRLELDTVTVREAGIEFDSPRPFDVMTEWDLMLSLPDSAQYLADAVVVGCEAVDGVSWRVSLYFLRLSEVASEIQCLTA